MTYPQWQLFCRFMLYVVRNMVKDDGRGNEERGELIQDITLELGAFRKDV